MLGEVELTVIRPAPSVKIDGEWQESTVGETSFTIMGSPQPPTGRRQDASYMGRKVNIEYTVYTTSVLNSVSKGQKADTVIVDGERLTVLNEQRLDFKADDPLAHRQYFLVKSYDHV